LKFGWAKAFTSCLVAASLSFGASPALAGEAEDLARAKTLFEVGAKAYGRGNFPAAIQAFEQSQKLAPRAGLVFSLAQAYRKQYYIDKQVENLSRALALYRDYLSQVPDGGRRAEAAEIIAELEPVAERLGVKADAGAGSAAKKTRIMISSPIEEALVELDGEKPAPAPLFIEAKPGKHNVKLTAPGYFPESRAFDLEEGAVVALDVALRELPAQVTVDTASGAQISVDGRYVATTPQLAPLELEPGAHLFTVVKNGHLAFSEEIDLGRGESRRIPAPLRSSSQRFVSYSLLGVSAAGLVAGGVFTGLAVAAQSQAQSILDQTRAGNVPAEKLSEYNQALASRTDFSRVAGIGFGIGAAAGIAGVLLYAFDAPIVTGKPAKKKTPEKTPVSAPTEVAAVPVFTPGQVGGVVSFRF